MLSRLPISLAQLEAGNNSSKLKNETRQLFYSLYCSKNMTKQIYNNLIKHIWIKSKLRILKLIDAHKIFCVIASFSFSFSFIIMIIIMIMIIIIHIIKI